MSAWGVGRASGSQNLAGDDGGLKAFVDRVIQWIPADVIAIYTLGITALASQEPNPNPSPAWLIIAAGLAFVLVLLGAYTTRKTIRGKDVGLAVLAVIAFAIWSLAIPESGWYEWDEVADNPGWVAIVAAVGGILFSAMADAFGD